MDKLWHCDWLKDFFPFVLTLGTNIYSARAMASYPFICPYDIPSRYNVIATLSYAVGFIVCTAADYHCLTCHTGDLKRQHLSQCCILLTNVLESLRHAGKLGLYVWFPILLKQICLAVQCKRIGEFISSVIFML